MDDRSALQLLFLGDDGEAVRWPYPDRAPANPESRRLLEWLGVTGIPEADAVSAALVNQQVRVAEGLNGSIVVMGAWCGRCGEESMPDRDGRCSYCRSLILDEDSLSASEMRQQLAGAMTSSTPIPMTERKESPMTARPTVAPTRGRARNRWNPYTRDELVGILRKVREKTGRVPSVRDVIAEAGVTLAPFTKHFGSFNEALAAAGMEPREPKSGRAAARPEPATESADPTFPPSDQPPASRDLGSAGGDPEPAPTGAGAEIAARPDTPSDSAPSNEVEKQEVARKDSGSIPEPDGGGFTLALTGDFARDAQRCRDEAALLRRQAEALDVIADGIDQLEAA